MTTITQPDLARGYTVCECAKFAFVFTEEAFRFLPGDYVGELCKTCNMWMCDVNRLPKEPAP